MDRIAGEKGLALARKWGLERFKKYCSRSIMDRKSGLFGLWLRFDSVTDRCGYAPLPKPRQNPKILAPNDCIIF